MFRPPASWDVDIVAGPTETKIRLAIYVLIQRKHSSLHAIGRYVAAPRMQSAVTNVFESVEHPVGGIQHRLWCPSLISLMVYQAHQSYEPPKSDKDWAGQRYWEP